VNPITVAAFDSGGNQVATTSSSSNNTAVSGDGAPNELLSLNGTNIAKVVITGNPAGNSVVAEDLSYTVPAAPAVNSLVSPASFQAGAVGSGSIATIFGANLTTQTLTAATLPLPATLVGFSATVGGLDTALYYVSPEQINLQIPANLPPGPAALVVKVNGTAATFTAQVAAIAPGLFLNGKYAAAVNLPSGVVNGPNAGAAPGSYVEVYITGAGTVSPTVATGVAAPSSPLSYVAANVGATIGGQPAHVAFAGLTPTLVDLVQVDVEVPAGLANGDYPVIVSVAGVASNAGLVRVSNP
jgi:uncharacterized protein (TIGR03437 family)